MDDRAKKVGEESSWEADHKGTMEKCADHQDEASSLIDSGNCNKDEVTDAAAHAHQYEACTLVGFGWVDPTDPKGEVNLTKMFADFHVNEEFKTQVNGTMQKCMQTVMGLEHIQVDEMHKTFVAKCPESAGKENEAVANEDAAKEMILAKMTYGAESKCAMGEILKACGLETTEKKYLWYTDGLL